MLEAEPVLCAQLTEALAGGRWLITIHRKVNDCIPDDLKAASTHKDYPLEDLVDSMQGQCRAILRDQTAKIQAQQAKAVEKASWT
jgi:hypothetical protein